MKNLARMIRQRKQKLIVLPERLAALVKQRSAFTPAESPSAKTSDSTTITASNSIVRPGFTVASSQSIAVGRAKFG